MSGGVAYVYDPEGIFPAKVNPELVDLEDLDGDDASFVRETLAMHSLETASLVAKEILDSWPRQLLVSLKLCLDTISKC